MQTTSSTWKALAARLGAPDALSDSRSVCLEARATVGGTVYGGIAPQIQRATMQDSLAVGNAVAASLLVSLRGAASVPRSAAVAIEVRLTDGETASEWLPQGTFYISRRSRDPVTGALALECYDAMLKANAIWTPTAGAWPRTMAAVVAELAGLLGVALDSRTAVPAAAMAEPPAGSTIRDALGTVAQAAGGNWIITPQDRLRLVRVGAAADALDVLGVTGALDVGQTGTVTGVRSTVDGLVTMIGDDTGIVVDVTIGALQAQDMAEELIGQTYQPYALTGAIYDPAAELGDSVRGGAGGEVASVLCAETANYAPAFRGTISAPQGGEMYDEFPYIGGTARALAAARAYAEQAAGSAVEALDASLTQEDIFNRLTDNGAAQGLVFLNGQLYMNATYMSLGELNAALVRIKNLSVSDIESGIIHSADYRTEQIAMIYPAATLFPGDDLYPNNGELVTSGFAIDFETGQIYGGFYSAQIATLQDAVTTLQSTVSAMQAALVYPKSATRRAAAQTSSGT